MRRWIAIVAWLGLAASAEAQPRKARVRLDETTASAAIKQRLQRARASASKRGLSTVFAYHTVSKRTLAEATGARPETLAELAARDPATPAQRAAGRSKLESFAKAAAAKARTFEIKAPPKALGGMTIAEAEALTKTQCKPTGQRAPSPAKPTAYTCQSAQGHGACMSLLHHGIVEQCYWTGHPEAFAIRASFGTALQATQEGCIPGSVNKTLVCWDHARFLECQGYARGGSLFACSYAPPTFYGSPAASRFDWRTARILPPVRDQGTCGSCWAFSALGVLEATVLLDRARTQLLAGGKVFPAPYKGDKLDFAEQHLLACGSGGNCGGGDIYWTLTWLLSHDTVAERDFPYAPSTDKCIQRVASTGIRVDHFATLDKQVHIPGRAMIKAYLVLYGPLVVTMWAGEDFLDYAGGVYSAFDSKTPVMNKASGFEVLKINHAVVIVGWDDSKGAWIVRNSWGPDWGSDCDFDGAYRHYKNYELGTFDPEYGHAYVKYESSNIGAQAKFIVPKIP